MRPSRLLRPLSYVTFNRRGLAAPNSRNNRLPDLLLLAGLPIIIILTVLGFPLAGSAQAIDNTVSFRSINSDSYFRFNYENDYFTKTDRDYSQGILLEYMNPRLCHFPLSSLLWHPENSAVNYGLSIEHNVYTPHYYERPDIQYGDRPFAGVLLLKTFLVAINSDRRERVSTQLTTGLIGPAAGGEGMQEGIHQSLGDTRPQGWHNQLRNGLALNYQVNYERELLNMRMASRTDRATQPAETSGHDRTGGQFSLASYSSARAGTLGDKLSTGFTAMLGSFHSPFTRNQPLTAKKIQYYVYDQLSVNLVGYDATLQGGLFNHTNPYTIPAGQINRVTIQNRYGAVLILKHCYLEYYQTSLTQEFRPSVFHRTGGIQVGFGF